jgi:hypothetical protein
MVVLSRILVLGGAEAEENTLLSLLATHLIILLDKRRLNSVLLMI